jgi:hypothetical protein
MCFFLFRSHNQKSENEIVVKGQDSSSANTLRDVGYICEMTKFDWTYDCKPCNRGSFKIHSRQTCELCPPGKLLKIM